MARGEGGAGEKARVFRGFRHAAQAEMAGPSGVGARGPEKVIRARALGVGAGAALWAREKPEKRRGCRRIRTSDKVQLSDVCSLYI